MVDTSVARPPITSYSPNMWEDTINSFFVDEKVQENYAETIKQLKEEVRNLLMSEENNTTTEKITLIDTIERLGVGYHFEEEIEKHLEQIYKYHHLNSQEYDLFTTALQFRLLRQHRYNIPCDVFDKFKDKSNDDKFDEKFTSDAKGLLSLYQAAHLRMHGENILEEALAFTTHHLNRMLPQLVSPLRDEVKQALEQPVHKGIPRMEAQKYISIYEINHDAKNDMILKLAKLDFNFLQNMYKKELILLMKKTSKVISLQRGSIPLLPSLETFGAFQRDVTSHLRETSSLPSRKFGLENHPQPIGETYHFSYLKSNFEKGSLVKPITIPVEA
ncbi:hypothetical protein RD792_013094 [Penstemon davidsonii]|uniref:Terpene synthase N-terminal domain-containing protein n=1 Tax=Penstemon davidsonii TaxID=160366 RepID=A0ABR0CSJ9_9LAMI|nr:hypothetical protein RD792_013094 [Penstemon davidsonii]